MASTKDTTRMSAARVATMRAHGETMHHPDPTPASPLQVPEASRRIDAHLEAYDESWSGLTTDSERLSHLNQQVRSLTVEQLKAKEHVYQAHAMTHAKVDALASRMDALETDVRTLATEVAGLRADVRGLSSEVAKLVTVMKATAGRQVEVQQKVEEVEEEMEQSQNRISQLSDVIAETQGEVADIGAEVVVLASEARPKLDSVRDLAERVSDGEQRDAAIQAKADAAAAEAAAARAEGEKTAGEVRSMRAWNAVWLGIRASVLVGTYEVVKHYALDILKAVLGH